MDLMVIIGFNGNYNGVYWYVMDSIGGMLNLIGKCPKHNRNVMYLMVIIGFNGHYNGVYWYVMDSIGGMLNPIWKMPKTQ